MGALTGDKNNIQTQGQLSEIKEFVVVNGQTVYYGSLVGIDLSNGQIRPLDGTTTTLVPIGIADEQVDGDGSKTAQVSVGPLSILNQAVANVSGEGDNGKPVYCTTDNIDDADISQPQSNLHEIGRVIRFVSSGNADILLYGLEKGLERVRDDQWKDQFFSSISDDDFDSFTPEESYGIAHVWNDAGDAQGFYFDLANGASGSLGTMGTTTLNNAGRTGTDGSDNSFNIGVDSGNGRIDIENRTGSAVEVKAIYSVGRIS